MVFSTGRRRAALELGFLVVLFSSIGVVESQCKRECEALASYYVWEGSNLTFIGELMGHKDPFEEILQYNKPQVTKDSLQAETRINIPFSCNCINKEFLGHVFDYPVRSGDTYEKVAQTWFSNLTTVDLLHRFNSRYIPGRISRLKVVVNCFCGDEDVSKDYGLFMTYPLRPGDSLASIANHLNLSAQLLQRYNPNSNFSNGSGVVYIPGSGLVYIPGKDPTRIYPPLTLSTGGLPLRSKIMIGVFVGVGVVGGLILLFLLFIYRKNQMKSRERIMTSNPNVEQFLETYGCLSLQRYKYKDIKKMTNSFKDKLGQGGYGSVFKGKLVDGRLVAVKVLINDPKKGNGEEFMNEVVTIGRTNHINVVSLLGFCVSGSKRALVYEFMPNGSLEKFIYAKKEKSTTATTSEIASATTTAINAVHQLGWEKLYQIALGIARGLEYLHRGCNTGRILHFDIKPHNILLDEKFCPKISDFGLAKLCPTRESIVSMHGGGRGTLGYIAPEVYCRNFGGVSYKSDVYSYGMMVLEMVGGRKNIDPFVDNTSEIYFPHWIYDHLEDQNDKIEDLLRFEGEFEEEMARKMIMAGLWCVQTNPSNRPSMSRVSEMLEGKLEDLEMPPKPIVEYFSPRATPVS